MRDIEGPQNFSDLRTEEKVEQEWHDKLWFLGDAYGNNRSKQSH